MFITKELIKEITKRDGYKCKVCGSSDNVGVSSIIPRFGYNIFNALLLCKYCNKLFAYYWQTNCKDYSEGYHPDDLYKLINSNKERALKGK